MFLYKAAPPEETTFAPDYSGTIEQEAGQRRATFDLWETTRNLQMFRDNANAEDMATAEAYDRRNKAIFDATGVQLANPRRDFTAADTQAAARAYDAGGNPLDVLSQNEAAWQEKVARLARERPDVAAIIAAERPIGEDARALTREAQAASGQAATRADEAGLSGLSQLGTGFGASMAGMLRDPLQVGTLFLGGGVAGPAKTAIGRIFETMLTEAVVNAGVEAGVQAAGADWKKSAGVDYGLGQSLQQVGLAALFGGGLGGLGRAAGEVFSALGRSAPTEPLARLAAGAPEPGDAAAVADALGLRLDPETARVADIAAEQDALDAAAFGPRPAELDPAEAERLAAQAIRDAENPPDRPPQDAAGQDLPERAQQADRIVRQAQPLGPAPKRPVTLMQFLAANGGIADHGGELKSIGLTGKTFVPGSGPLVRKKGVSLDYAREAAAEAGYFDHLKGDPDRATAETTVADLLSALDQEARGAPLYSARNDGGRMFAWLDYEQRQVAQQSYRRLIEDVQAAQAQLGIDHRIDDQILMRAAELVDDQTDPLSALERAMDEDYRSFYDAQIERGGPAHDDSDIPFYQDGGPVPRAGEAAGTAGADGGQPGRDAAAPDGAELFDARADEGESALEPATPAAAERAALALTEARGAHDDEYEVMLRDAIKRDFAAFIELEKRVDDAGGIDEAPADLRDEYLFAEQSLIEDFQLAGLPGDSMDTGARAINSAADIKNAFNKATLEEKAKYWLMSNNATTGSSPATERTAAGEQTLLGGVAPVTTRQKLEAQAAKPLRGGDKPAGGLFDETARNQMDIWDAIPVSRDADGAVQHVTYDELVAEAERDDFFGDLVASCKD